MRFQNKEIPILTFLIGVFLLASCKHDVAGCSDVEATNWDSHANLNDGSCKYLPFIKNPDFERDNDWSTYSGGNFSPYAFITDQGDGFMPTHGNRFFKCIPYVNYYMGTFTLQFCEQNKHYKGFYFDYSYIGIAESDSILIASVEISYVDSKGVSTHWSKMISETPLTFSGFPEIKIQKKEEYLDFPQSKEAGEFYIKTSVSKGTFTFCIDNIREVKR